MHIYCWMCWSGCVYVPADVSMCIWWVTHYILTIFTFTPLWRRSESVRLLLVCCSVNQLVFEASQGLAVTNSLLAVIRQTVWARPGISTSWFWWGCIMTAGNHPQLGMISSNSISHIVTWLSNSPKILALWQSGIS